MRSEITVRNPTESPLSRKLYPYAFTFVGSFLLASLTRIFAFDFGITELAIVSPAAGFCLATAHHWRKKVLPAIGLGTFLARLFVGAGTPLDALVYGACTVVQAGTTAWFIRWVFAKYPPRGIAARAGTWLLIGGTLGCIWVPTAVILELHSNLATRSVAFSELRFLWVQRWSAEAIGTIVCAPLAHLWFYERERNTTNRVLTSCILVACLFACTAILNFWNRSESAIIRENLTLQTSSIEQAIRRQMNLSLGNLHALAQFFEAKGPITRTEFLQFVMPLLDSQPGVLAYEWISRVPHFQRAEFERRLRSETGIANVEIRMAERPYNVQRHPPADEYFPITYIEPRIRNEIALGYNVSATPRARTNLELAWQSGKAALSEPLTLVQEESDQLSVVGYFPIFSGADQPLTLEERKRRLSGFVGSLYRIGDLMAAALRHLNLEGTILRLEDVGSGSPLELFSFDGKSERVTTFTQTRTFQIENRTWRIFVGLTPTALQGHRRPAQLTLPVGGVVTTAAFVLLIMILSGRSAETESLVASRTQELQRALRVRDDFVLAISHELKTPLTPLRLQIDFLQLLVKEGRMADFAKTPEFPNLLGNLGREVETYARLVGDLLDISRFSSGNLSIRRERCDLAIIARDVVELIASDVTLEIHGNPVGDWDPQRIRQVLTNLVSNAKKYGRGNPISVRIEGRTKLVRIQVTDQGIGIDPNEIDRIFDRFHRAVDIQNYAGLGIGLFIVKEIVTAHGGRITAESRVGQGSTFTIELPTQAEDRPFG